MKLPKLVVLQDEKREPVSCEQRDYCKECVFFEKNGGRCEGCTPQHRYELKEEFGWCYQECHSCTGYKANVTAVCCRSPLKQPYLDAVTRNPSNWNQPDYKYTAREQLSFDRKAIFYISQKCQAKAVMGDALADHEVVATSMKVVTKPNGTGFVSNDLHDFLNLKKKTKIILTTMDIDDRLEAAWEASFYENLDVFEKVGLSYWMPLAFSTYGGDAKMHSIYQWYRTQLCTEKSQAHFFSSNRPLMRVDDLILKALEKIPQVIFNVQFFSPSKAEVFKQEIAKIRRWHELAPPGHAFWFVGASTPMFVRNVRNVCGQRDLYFISGKPLYMTMWGQRMKTDGNERDLLPGEHPDKPDLVRENFAMFESIVKQWSKPDSVKKTKKEKR